MHARMRERVHIIHHKRRYAPSIHVLRRPAPIWPSSYVRLASEKCQQEKRKTVNGEDILFAMTSLGFENYAEALKIYLAKYREVSHALLTRLLRRGYSSEPPPRSGSVLCSEVLTSFKTQSTRGDNQPRPGSGYGAPPQGGTSGGSGASAPSQPPSSTAYHQPTEGVNHILSPHGLEGTEQDNSPYGNVYPATAGNGAEPY